jgi:hypothetical protein
MNTRSERDPAMRTVAWAAVLLFTAVFASECARAQEQEVAFRASVTATYSDNPARTATAQSATALDGLVGLSVTHQSPLLYVDARASALERGYVEGNLPSETLANGYLNLLAGPAGGLFTWTVTDSFGQISSQPFGALSANDRQNVNVLSTGPNLRIQLDSRDHFDLAGRYRLDSYGTSSLDDHGYTGQAEFAHDIGATSHAGVVYAYQRIDFQQGTLGAAKIEQAYAKYRLAGARSYIVLEAGADQLDQGVTGRQHTSHALALLQRHLTERLTFEAAYRHDYTEPAGAFVAASRDGFTVGTDQTVQALALPFEESSGYAQLTRSAGRLLAAIEITASEETYPANSASKRRTVGSNFAADYQLSSRVRFSVRAGYYEEKFPNAQQDGHWVNGSIGFSRMLGRSLQLSLLGTRIKSTGNLLNGDFTENRAVLALTYAPGAERLQRIYDTNAPFRFYDRSPPQPPPASQPPH